MVGIFPEGGSHDRPEMLPLQAGVAIMALETLSKFPGAKLKIVPVGLHYFNADKVLCVLYQVSLSSCCRIWRTN